MANFNLPDDGERTVLIPSGETFTIVVDTRPWGRFEEIIAAYQDESEQLRGRRDELLLAEAGRRGINLSDELEKRIDEDKNSVAAIARAKLELAIEWNAALLGSYELVKRRFARELCRWGLASHEGITLNGEAKLPFLSEESEYQDKKYRVVSDETLDAYSRLGLLEPIADEIYKVLFPTEEEKKS